MARSPEADLRAKLRTTGTISEYSIDIDNAVGRCDGQIAPCCRGTCLMGPSGGAAVAPSHGDASSDHLAVTYPHPHDF